MSDRTPTRTRPNRETDIKPSAPGSVDAWLDMLVSMLALPKPERQRIRDELEDHLRSRIDDLLITGHTEPEALQKAASELGETADLARQLTHAHGPNRKRTYAMHAALIALAGSITAVTISLTGGTPPNTINGVPIISGVPVVGMAAEDEQAVVDGQQAVEVDLDTVPFREAFRVVAESFSLTPGLSAAMINRYAEHETSVTMRGSFTLEHAMERLLSFDPYGSESNAYYIEDARIVIADPMVVIRRSVETKIYPLEWAEVHHHAELTAAVRSALLSGPYPQFVNVDNAVGSLVVTARDKAHGQAAHFLSELQRNYEVRIASAAQEAEKQRVRVRAEYERLRQQLAASAELANRVESRLAIVHGKLASGDLQGQDLDALRAEQSALGAELDQIRFEYRDLEERFEFIRSRLIEVDYADLF